MFSATRQSRDPISHGHALFQKPRICTLVPGIVVNDKSQACRSPCRINQPAIHFTPAYSLALVFFSDNLLQFWADRPTGRVAATVSSKCGILVQD